MCKEQQDNNKDDVALSELLNFSSRLQHCMQSSGFEYSETEVDNPIFLHFMHLTLHDLVQRLFRVKLSKYQQISDEERNCGLMLNVKSNLSVCIEPRMKNALQLIGEELPVYLKHGMGNAGFNSYEIQETHQSFESLFSKFAILETKNLMNLKSKVKCVVDDKIAHLETQDLCSGDDETSLVKITNRSPKISMEIIDLVSNDQCSSDHEIASLEIINLSGPSSSSSGIVILSSQTVGPTLPRKRSYLETKVQCLGDDEISFVKNTDISPTEKCLERERNVFMEIIDPASNDQCSCDNEIALSENINLSVPKSSSIGNAILSSETAGSTNIHQHLSTQDVEALCGDKHSDLKDIHVTGAEIEHNPKKYPKKLVAETKKHYIYRLSSEKIVIKLLKSCDPLEKDIKNLDNELKVTKLISHPAIRQADQRIKFQNTQALVLGWAKGYPISDAKEFAFTEFLSIAREIVSSLQAIHMKHMIHLNLCCEHVIYNPVDKSIAIIGCGSSSSFDSKKSYISNQELKERDLRFISPEQTGRANLKIDHRSDFYSLGIILYTMVTGKYPFACDNVLKLLKLHLFQDPVPVCMIAPNIPLAVSDMISKLLAKRPEERYQSAKGIIYDIDLMISEYESDRTLSSVRVLAQHDTTESLLLQHKLYGRSRECKKLYSVFDRMSMSSFELVFVTGASGAGKSSLVFELHKPVARNNGVLMSGKCHFAKSQPYSALLEAVNIFCDDLLLNDKITIANYKTQINDAVGEEGRILTNVISNLKLIIGEQPCISSAFGQEAKNRFNYLFIKFFKAICAISSPLVLILEDLQWVDSESFDLISVLVKESIKNLMIVCVYRDNEVSDEHPLAKLLHDIKILNINSTNIVVGNFDHETVNALVSDTLCVPLIQSYSLTAIIHKKTKGNPFFVTQMLLSLAEQELIFFCNDTYKWKWDNSTFGESDLSENVRELLRQKIIAFDEQTKQTLKVASCLGSPFPLEYLKLIVNSSKGFEGAMSTGILTPYQGSNTMYHFAHDEIQQATFSLLPNDKDDIFLYMATKLWKLSSNEKLHQHIFTITNLFLHVVGLLRSKENFKIAELFMLAGHKAMASTDFEKASVYLDAGIKLLDSNCWQGHHYLTLKLYNAAAEVAYCLSNYTILNAYKDIIQQKATSMLDLVQVYSLQIKLYNDDRKFVDAFHTADCILSKIGENIKLAHCDSTISSEVSKAISFMSKSNEDVLQIENLKDETLLAIMMILNEVLASVYYSNPRLFFFISARMVQITFQNGISKFSSVGFSAFGAALCSQGNDLGYRFGKLSIMLLNQIYAKELVAWVYGSFYGLINPFYASIHDSVDPYMAGYKISLEVGSTLGLISNAGAYCSHAFLSGKPLTTFIDYIEELNDLLPIKTTTYLSIYQTVLNLLGRNSENPAILIGEVFDFRSSLDGKATDFDVMVVLQYCCFVAYIFNDYSSSMNFAEKCRPLQNSILFIYNYPIHLFYDGLVSLALARHKKEKCKLVKHAQESIAILRNRSEKAPVNFQNKVHLLEAEMAAVLGDESQALIHYKAAILLSNKHGFPHEEAIAYERKGMFLLENNSPEAAMQSLLKSYHCYRKWGAVAKMHQLTKTYPLLCERDNILPSNVEYSLGDMSLEDNHSYASVSMLS